MILSFRYLHRFKLYKLVLQLLDLGSKFVVHLLNSLQLDFSSTSRFLKLSFKLLNNLCGEFGVHFLCSYQSIVPITDSFFNLSP